MVSLIHVSEWGRSNMKPSEYKISSEKFNFVQDAGRIHDKELSTKPVGYLKDAFTRFKKNKGSIVAACIILMLILFAVIGPIPLKPKIVFM